MPPIRTIRTSLTLLALALVSGACATHPVTVHEDPRFDAGALESFAWMPADKAPKSQVGLAEPLTDVRVRRAVEAELVGKGYKMVAAEKADFWIGYIRFIRLQRERVSFGSYADDIDGIEPARSRWFKRDSLFLDIVSPVSTEILWRGMTQCVVGDESEEKKREKIRLHVHLILERFPIRPEIEARPEKDRPGIKSE